MVTAARMRGGVALPPPSSPRSLGLAVLRPMRSYIAQWPVAPRYTRVAPSAVISMPSRPPRRNPATAARPPPTSDRRRSLSPTLRYLGDGCPQGSASTSAMAASSLISQPSELRPRVENATAKQSPAWQSLRLAPAGELQAGVLLLLAAIPELLVEEVGDAVAQRLDQGHGAAQG